VSFRFIRLRSGVGKPQPRKDWWKFLRIGGRGKNWIKEELIQELYRQIGQLKVDLDWLKKNLVFSHKEKLLLIDKEN